MFRQPIIVIMIIAAILLMGVTVFNTSHRAEATHQTVADHAIEGVMDHRIEIVNQEGIRDPAYGTVFYVTIVKYQGDYYLTNSKGGICAKTHSGDR